MSEPGSAASTAESSRTDGWLLLLFFVLLLPFCFVGYGSDNDTYGVLDSGRVTWHYHGLLTSRPPGYWAYEALMFVLNRAGGHVLTNGATLLVSVFILWRFLHIARRMGVRYPKLTAACVMVTPMYAIASCSTIDYVWSIAGLVVLVEMAEQDRWGWAAAGATFAYLIRTANGVIIGGIILAAIVAELQEKRRLTPRIWRLLAVGCVAAVLGSLPLIASYRSAGNSFAFLQGMIGDAAMWTMKMRVGRFFYKGMGLFGLPATLYLIALLGMYGRRESLPAGADVLRSRRRLTPMLLGGVLANLVLFFKYPIELSYLLPGCVFFLLLLGVRVLRTRAVTVALLALIAVTNFVAVRLAKPNISGRATAATFQPGLDKGEFLDDLVDRENFRACDGTACFIHVMKTNPRYAGMPD